VTRPVFCSRSQRVAAARGRDDVSRYDHAAVQLEGKMYVVGGNARGTLLADTSVLDLTTLAWAPPQQQQGGRNAATGLPACAAHVLVVARGKVSELRSYRFFSPSLCVVCAACRWASQVDGQRGRRSGPSCVARRTSSRDRDVSFH